MFSWEASGREVYAVELRESSRKAITIPRNGTTKGHHRRRSFEGRPRQTRIDFIVLLGKLWVTEVK